MNIRSVFGETKSKVFNYLAMRKYTAGEVAAKLDIQLNAARKHLESLKSRGLVKEEYVIDGVGRPKKFYTLTGAGRDLLQNQSSSVLSLFLAGIVRSDGVANAENVVKQIAMEIASSMHANGSEKTIKGENQRTQEVQSLVASLDKFGFETSLEDKDQSYTITSRHCPLRESANAHQKLICVGLHGEIIKAALATEDVKLGECMALGDSTCTHIIPKQRRILAD